MPGAALALAAKGVQRVVFANAKSFFLPGFSQPKKNAAGCPAAFP
jgi:hypothetical protein